MHASSSASPASRLEFDKSFRIDVGGRVNQREFEDRDIIQFDSAFLDVNLYWRPLDAFKFTAIVERIITGPSTSFGIADDKRTVGTTLDWNFSEHWRLSGAGYYDRVEPIGDDFRYSKFLATLSLSYEPNDKLEYFLSTLGKWVNEEVTGESYDRYKIGVGARRRF